MDIRRLLVLPICCCWCGEIRPLGSGGQRGRRRDHFDVQPGPEGLEVRDGELVGNTRVVVGGGQEGGELREAEGGEDRHDVGVVAEVEVEGLVEREGGCVVVECRVDLGAGVAEGVVFETGNYFLGGWGDGLALICCCCCWRNKSFGF